MEGNKRNEELVLRKACYKKLWKLLIDREISRPKLSEMSKVGASTLTKLAKGECVNMGIIIRLCNTLECEISDIVELVPVSNEELASRRD